MNLLNYLGGRLVFKKCEIGVKKAGDFKHEKFLLLTLYFTWLKSLADAVLFY
jgi:hypothetical protein